jgi:hypothetical protein
MSEQVRWSRAKRARWGVAPPLLATPYWSRFTVESADAELFIILSHHVEETATHFIDGRTVGCTGEQGVCWIDHVLHGGGRYECWLAVFSPKFKRNYIINLTKVAVAQEPRLRLADEDLRGLTLSVSRRYHGRRAPMRCNLRGDPRHAGNLDPAPDLRVLVERLWAAEDRADSRNRSRGQLASGTSNHASRSLFEEGHAHA